MSCAFDKMPMISFFIIMAMHMKNGGAEKVDRFSETERLMFPSVDIFASIAGP